MDIVALKAPEITINLSQAAKITGSDFVQVVPL